MPSNPTYTTIKAATDSNVTTRDLKAKQILTDTEKIKVLDAQIREAKANGQSTTALESSKTSLQNSITSNTTSLNSAVNNLNTQRGYYDTYIDHTQVVSNLPDTVPILLFPVRIETRFHKYMNGPTQAYQLWIRIFPDDVAVETHEPALSEAEIIEGRAYWTKTWTETDQVKITNAWNVLCSQFTSQRAAWIVKQVIDGSITPKPAAPPFWTDAQLEKRFTTWTQAPQTRVMPDAFIANLYQTYNAANPIPTLTKQGKAIPFNLKVGIDPNDGTSFQRTGANTENLDAHTDIKWLIDFDDAILKGMGMKVDLTLAQYNAGFERITVVGVKALVNDTQGKTLVEALIDNHHYNAGFSLLKQGTNTKNTQEGPSGYSDYEFGNVSKEIELGTTKVTSHYTATERDKTDGQRLAEALGINNAFLDHIYHADGYDIRDAMNMNTILFTATMGYTMDVMLYPAFSTSVVTTYNAVEETRVFMTDYVRSRGALPSVSVRKQPYGVLPVTAYKKWVSMPTDPKKLYYNDVYSVSGKLDTTWTSAVPGIKVAGHASAQQAFVESLGKNAVSQEYYSRYGAGPSYVWNNLTFNDMQPQANQWYNNMQTFGQQTLLQTGFTNPQMPYALQMNFKEDQGLITSGLVDSQPLSDTLPLEPITAANSSNYITWLRTASLFQIRDENFTSIGGAPGQAPPDSLLYVYMRQSVLLEYYNAACKLLELPEAQRTEKEIINIYNVPTEGVVVPPQFQYQSGPSRWEVFDRPYSGMTVGMFLDSPPGQAHIAMANMQKMRQSMLQIETLPTADLALLVTEHLDLCSFRLDSWKLGLMNQRLNYMRLNANGTVKKQGIYVGAYGWVEKVTKNERALVASPNLPATYTETNIEEMTGNKGFIHAPSQNQAIAAAILRAGYDAKATSSNNKDHEINLTSERVRSSMNIFEGIKNGQKLAALLGYEFERALHERNGTLNLDQFIYPFRTKYKLEILTAEYDGAAEAVSAINVLNGKAILDDYKSNADSVFTSLVFTNSHVPDTNEKNAIKDQLNRLLGILDAVGDMAVSEGIFQIINNNYEAANALSASLTGSTNPPDAQVIKTPKSGTSLTNRVIKQLIVPQNYIFAPGTIPSNTWSQLSKSRRAIAEPGLNEWLLARLPAPGNIEIHAEYYDNATPPQPVPFKVYLSDLNIQPVDLIYITQEKLSNNESELAQRVKKKVREAAGLGLDKEISINFEASPASGKKRLYDIHSYIVYLKKVILDGRHIKSSDYCQAGSTDASLADRYDYAELYDRIDKVINGRPGPVPPGPPATPPADPPFLIHGLVPIKTIIDQKISLLDVPTLPTYGDVYVEALANAMMMAADFGIERTIPKHGFASDAASVKDLVDAAKTASELITKRLAEVALIFNTTNTPAYSGTHTDVQKSGYAVELVKCSKKLFGDSFRIMPLIKVQDNTKTALNNKFKLAGSPLVSPNTLLNDQSGDKMVMEEWFSGVSRVRKRKANLEMVSLLSDVVTANLNMNTISFRPFQIPYDDDTYDRWLAVKVSSTDTEKKLKSNRLCLAISEDIDTDFNNFICGWVVDDWTELIPSRDEVTGLAFHYDQPESKPPQVMLLAMPPVFTGSWVWNDLLSTVNETLDEAKKRAVDFETISASPFGHVLPATSLPVTVGAMTIGPSFTTVENLF